MQQKLKLCAKPRSTETPSYACRCITASWQGWRQSRLIQAFERDKTRHSSRQAWMRGHSSNCGNSLGAHVGRWDEEPFLPFLLVNGPFTFIAGNDPFLPLLWQQSFYGGKQPFLLWEISIWKIIRVFLPHQKVHPSQEESGNPPPPSYPSLPMA